MVYTNGIIDKLDHQPRYKSCKLPVKNRPENKHCTRRDVFVTMTLEIRNRYHTMPDCFVMIFSLQQELSRCQDYTLNAILNSYQSI